MPLEPAAKTRQSAEIHHSVTSKCYGCYKLAPLRPKKTEYLRTAPFRHYVEYVQVLLCDECFANK